MGAWIAPRISIRTLMRAVVILALLLGIARPVLQLLEVLPDAEGEPSGAGAHAMGTALIAGIESWRSHHGRYPFSLAEAGLVSPTRYRGGFIYRLGPGGATFQLELGEANGYQVKHVFHSDRSVWECYD